MVRICGWGLTGLQWFMNPFPVEKPIAPRLAHRMHPLADKPAKNG